MNLRLTPYPEYKDSGLPWLGGIPRHWHTGPGFAAFREKQVKNTGMMEKTVLSLSYGRIVVKPTEKLHGLVPLSFDTYQIVDPGDIIIRSTDLQNDWNSLRVGLVRDRGIITSAYLCFATTGTLMPEYGYLQLHAFDLMKVFYGMGSGLRQNLAFSDFKRMLIFIPPPAEQSAIVRFLDHADRRIRRYIGAKRRLIELLNEQKQAIIHRSVTRGLNPNVRLRASGVRWLPNVPEHWITCEVGHLARVGNGSTPSRGNSKYWTAAGYPWLNSSSVNQDFITHADQFVTDVALRECHLPRVPPASVLVAITGQGKTRGKAAMLCFESTINQHIAYITPKSSISSPEFLHLLLTAAYPELRAISDDSGSTKGALTCDDLKHFHIVLPPLNEQVEILAAARKEVEQIQPAIAQLRSEADLTLEYRTRLIADVVTGKLDVRAVELPQLEEAQELAPVGDEMADDATEEERELKPVEEMTDAAE